MTANEKSQPDHVFVNAGKKAFHLGIFINGNPYTEQPYRGLWERGFMNDKKLCDQAEFAKRSRTQGETKYAPPTATPTAIVVKAVKKNWPKVTQKPFRTVALPGTKFTVREQKPKTVRIPKKSYRSGTIGDYVAGTVRKETR